MKYIILSINDDRIGYKENIRAALGPENEIPFEAVNGSDPDQVERTMAEFENIFFDGQKPLFYDWEYKPKKGEVGVWLSNLKAWKLISQMNEPVLVLEDDAIPRANCLELIDFMIEQMPKNWHFAPVFTPHDCIFIPHALSWLDMEHSEVIARVYQTYCHVAVMYTPDGARRLLDYAAGAGLRTPVDIFTMQAGQMMLLNGYAFQHHDHLPFTYDWSAETTIHKTEHIQWKEK